ncbi:MAG: hypothetical protein PXZ08_07575, partial [Actinomycetota bacterium]|nr:hypothetical protein [Actinomycetota bacterium]
MSENTEHNAEPEAWSTPASSLPVGENVDESDPAPGIDDAQNSPVIEATSSTFDSAPGIDDDQSTATTTAPRDLTVTEPGEGSPITSWSEAASFATASS